ncbi:MAG: hypothetical protein N4A62_03850 [Marinisporobacter sp.]|nr:hypothetical protein [Marinisporobacter sp.]
MDECNAFIKNYLEKHYKDIDDVLLMMPDVPFSILDNAYHPSFLNDKNIKKPLE